MTQPTKAAELPDALRLADALRKMDEAKKYHPSGPGGQTLGCEQYRLIASGFTFEYLQSAAAELRRLHAYCQELESQVILDCMTHVQNPAEIEHVVGDVSKNGAEVNTNVYAELPPRYYLAGGVEKTWDQQQMCVFADATHALRASHGQASPQAGEYPALVCDYCGALTPDPWHSSGMLHGKMSKHIHSCDACASHGQAPAGGGAVVEWHAPGLGEVHNESHGQLIFCTDGDDVADDTLARRVCAALNATPAATPSAASLAWTALRDLTDPLGEAGVKIMGHVRIYAQRQYEAGLTEGRATPPAQAADRQPAPEYVGNGMFKGETIEKAAEHWANWCDVRCMTGLSEFLRVVAARAPTDSVLEDAARLDWLALAGPTSICLVIDRPHDGEVEVATDDVTGYGKTLREAIDAAMNKGGA